MMHKYSTLSLATLYTLLMLVNLTALADEVIGQQQVFNKLASSFSQLPDSTGIFEINGEILSLKTLSEHDKAAA